MTKNVDMNDLRLDVPDPSESTAQDDFETGFRGVYGKAEKKLDELGDSAASSNTMPITVDQFQILVAKAREVDLLWNELAQIRQILQQNAVAAAQAQSIAMDPQEQPTVGTIRDKCGAEFSDMLSKQIAQVVRPHLIQHVNDVESRLLDLHEPDWRKIIRTSEFNKWFATLPREQQKQFRSTNRSDHIIERIRHFRANQEAENERKQKSERLERNINPRGTEPPNSAVSDDDAFAIGFRTVRGGKK